MRAGGGCTVHQALTAESAGIVKQSVTLARRRGHAQVTPLHVASTMLSLSSGLLRTACLRSHSHPLQCKALELCFNVSLNRLPSSAVVAPGSTILGPSHSHRGPSISNALLAAFKRAQAHQRRGGGSCSVETQQQQPIMAVKIELEQLIISILDDPSVSRVMREAGFSSTQVKTNVEQAVFSVENKNRPQPQPQPLPLSSNSKPSNVLVRDEDVMSVIESLVMNKRRRKISSTVMVGECVTTMEGVVREVMGKVEKGDAPEAVRGLKFVNLDMGFSNNNNNWQFCREGVERKLGELRSLLMMKSCEVVLYLGDLEWTTYNEVVRNNRHCSLQHMVMEIGKLVCGINGDSNTTSCGGKRFWVMGIASFQTYIKCKSRQPSVETLWGLHPLVIPAGSLGLSLIPADTSDLQRQSIRSKKGGDHEGSSGWLLLHDEDHQEHYNKHQATSCTDRSTNFEIAEEEAGRRLHSCSSTSNSDSTTSSSLPTWFQQFKDENTTLLTNDDQNCIPIRDVCRKWNKMGTSVDEQPNNSSGRTLTLSSTSPSSSTSGFSYEQQYPNPPGQTHHNVWNIFERVNATETLLEQPTFKVYIPDHKKDPYKEPNCYSSNRNSSILHSMEAETDRYGVQHGFKAFNGDNLKTLTTALQNRVPWQRDIIPEIAVAVLRCRSGMVARKGTARNGSGSGDENAAPKEDTWLFFQGTDGEAKEKVAVELARLVFGSENTFISLALSSFSPSTRADSTEYNISTMRNKRSRHEQTCGYYLGMFAEAVSENPHRVFFIEDVEQVDDWSLMGIKRAAERGRVRRSSSTSGGGEEEEEEEEVCLSDAIVILCCESFNSRSRACSPPPPSKQRSSSDRDEVIETSSHCVALDLNISICDKNEDEKMGSAAGLIECVDRRIVFNVVEL